MKYSSLLKETRLTPNEASNIKTAPKGAVASGAGANRRSLGESASSSVTQNIPTIDSSFEIVKNYYDNTLNLDKSTYTSSNDEPTPISCILRMIKEIPEEL